VLAVISILLFVLSFRMFTDLFRRRTYCAAANGTRLSANRPAHWMNSMSSNWGTSGGQPVSSTSARPATASRMTGRRVATTTTRRWRTLAQLSSGGERCLVLVGDGRVQLAADSQEESAPQGGVFGAEDRRRAQNGLEVVGALLYLPGSYTCPHTSRSAIATAAA
jgi:hypothetical protein